MFKVCSDDVDGQRGRVLMRGAGGNVLLNCNLYKSLKVNRIAEKQCMMILQFCDGLKGVLFRFSSSNDLDQFVSVIEQQLLV
jgi:hypothetical protein